VRKVGDVWPKTRNFATILQHSDRIFCTSRKLSESELAPKCSEFYPPPPTIGYIKRFCASNRFLNVRKVDRFSQNFVQKMILKVSAVNFCTPHQLSKTGLAPLLMLSIQL